MYMYIHICIHIHVYYIYTVKHKRIAKLNIQAEFCSKSAT